MGWIGGLVLDGAVAIIIYKAFINPAYSSISYKKPKSRYRHDGATYDQIVPDAPNENDYSDDSSSDD